MFITVESSTAYAVQPDADERHHDPAAQARNETSWRLSVHAEEICAELALAKYPGSGTRPSRQRPAETLTLVHHSSCCHFHCRLAVTPHHITRFVVFV